MTKDKKRKLFYLFAGSNTRLQVKRLIKKKKKKQNLHLGFEYLGIFVFVFTNLRKQII